VEPYERFPQTLPAGRQAGAGFSSRCPLNSAARAEQLLKTFSSRVRAVRYNKRMSKQTYFYAVSGFFLVAGALHLIRAVSGWEVTIADVSIPVWLSWVVVFLAGFLFYQGIQHGRKM